MPPSRSNRKNKRKREDASDKATGVENSVVPDSANDDNRARRARRNPENVIDLSVDEHDGFEEINAADEDVYDEISLEGWLQYNRRRCSEEEAIALLAKRLAKKSSQENNQLQTGSSITKRERIARGVVVGFSPPCPKCGCGVYPVFEDRASSSSVFKGYKCGGAYDRSIGDVISCGLVTRSAGTRRFVSPYDYVNKYLTVTGRLPFMPSQHVDQTKDGRAGQLYRNKYGRNWQPLKGYNPLPVCPWGY